jgi:hypothetical protein
MLRQGRPDRFARWIQACADSGIAELQYVAPGLVQEESSIRAALHEPWTSGQGKGQLRRLKFLKRQMYGRALFARLSQRVLYAPWRDHGMCAGLWDSVYQRREALATGCEGMHNQKEVMMNLTVVLLFGRGTMSAIVGVLAR